VTRLFPLSRNSTLGSPRSDHALRRRSGERMVNAGEGGMLLDWPWVGFGDFCEREREKV